MTRGKLRAIALAVPVLLVAAACGGASPTAATSASPTAGTSASPINIGVSAPLTGTFAEDGAYMKEGINLAVNEINGKGGINGRKITVFYEDDQGPNPTAASNAVTKLLTADQVVAVLGPHFTPAMLPSEPIFDKYKVPALTGASGPPVTAQGNKWIHRIRLNDAVGAKVLVNYVVDELKWKTIGLDYVNTAFGQSGIEVVKSALQAKGITPAVVQTHQDDTKDFTSQIVAFSKANVDGIIVWTDDQPGGLLLKQMATLGAKFKLAGSTTFSQPTSVTLAGEAANGAVSISDFSQSNPDPSIQSWEKKFEAVYGKTPELYASAYYDAMNVLAEAMRKATTLDGPSINDALNNIKGYRGVMTTYTNSANGDMVHSGLITEVKNGKVVVIRAVQE